MKKIAIAALAAVMAAGLVSCGTNGAKISADDKDKIVWENKYIAVSFTELDESDPLDPHIRLRAKNKSDKTMYLFPQALYINDYFFEPIMNESIDAGATVDTVIDIKSGGLEYSGISEVDSISLWLMTNDPEKSGFDNLYINSDEITISTGRGGDTPEPEGTLLADTGGIRIKQLPGVKTGNADIVVPIYIENSTGGEAYVEMTALRIDGKTASPSEGNNVSLKAGKKAVVAMSVVDTYNQVITEHFSTTEVQFTITTPDGKKDTKSETTGFAELKDLA